MDHQLPFTFSYDSGLIAFWILQVIYGLDFTLVKREEQLEAVRSAILEHVR